MTKVHAVVHGTIDGINYMNHWLEVWKVAQDVAYYEGDMEMVMKIQKQIDEYNKQLDKLYKKQEKAYKDLLIEVL